MVSAPHGPDIRSAPVRMIARQLATFIELPQGKCRSKDDVELPQNGGIQIIKSHQGQDIPEDLQVDAAGNGPENSLGPSDKRT